jgi:Lon protease-like protein
VTTDGRQERAVAEERFEIPLLPLNVVLFPGMALPLHVFEPRYRRMTASCLDDRAPFGVVLRVAEGEPEEEIPARVGTLARIADCERLPDGRYNLLALGTRRFELLEVRRAKPYLTGLVQPVRDLDEEWTPTGSVLEEARAEVREYLRTVLALVGSEDRCIEIPDNAAELSYLIGMCLTCDDCQKQELLELTSTARRLQAGLAMLHAERKALSRQLAQSKQRAASVDRSLLN